MKAAKREQVRQVMSDLHARWCLGPNYEIHHIFGRDGRLAACRLFCTPVAVPKGCANHHDLKCFPEMQKQWRANNREEFIEFTNANQQNADVTTCWHSGCVYWYQCPLAEEAP